MKAGNVAQRSDRIVRRVVRLLHVVALPAFILCFLIVHCFVQEMRTQCPSVTVSFCLSAIRRSGLGRNQKMVKYDDYAGNVHRTVLTEPGAEAPESKKTGATAPGSVCFV